MLSNKRLIFALLFIFTTLIYASYGINSDITDILDKRDNNNKRGDSGSSGSSSDTLKKYCSGFRFLYPYAKDDTSYNQPIQIQNNTNITVMWAKDASSSVKTCMDCEMLQSGHQFIQIVWKKGIDMTPGYASASVHFSCDPGTPLPITVTLRAIGQTAEGPRCAAYS
ncbi:12580_t:CDS:2, partial [Dentiscutata erythropus]